ncbi:CD151 antigen-like [Zophobas morio]|uniref:CD151 antigen-like n=1 Tax=Zophobas morio TaxID=2755281 RepID=UPI0030833658
MSWLTSLILKLAIYISNLITASGAIVLIAFGAEYIQSKNNGVSIFGDFLFGVLSVTVGTIALVVCIFGCVSACFEKSIFLKIYAGILMGLFTIQLSLGIMAVTKVQNPDRFSREVTKTVQRLFEEDRTQFYVLQQEFECCGVNGYFDYNNTFPTSCCNSDNNPCLRPFETGCATAFRDVIGEYIKTIGFVAIVFAALELMCAFFAFTVRRKIQSVSDSDDCSESSTTC